MTASQTYFTDTDWIELQRLADDEPAIGILMEGLLEHTYNAQELQRQLEPLEKRIAYHRGRVASAGGLLQTILVAKGAA